MNTYSISTVAHILFPYLDKTTVLALSSARKDLRRDAARWVLRRPILADTPARGASFVHFVQGGSAKLEGRSRLVTALTISLPVEPTTAGRDRLVNALLQLRSLHDLRLVDPEAAMAVDTRVVDALAELPKLKALSIVGAGPESCLFLSSMLSRPTTIEIVPRCDEHDPLFSVCAALAAHSSTVVRLSLGAGAIPFGDQDEPIGFDTVEQLTLSRCVPDCGSDWMSTFPNVSVLDAGAARLTLGRGMLDVRDRNCNANDALNGWPNIGLFWPNLSLIRGGVIDTFIMGNVCRTSVLELDGVVGEAEAQHLVDVICDCRPTTLRMTVSPGCCRKRMVECEEGSLAPLRGVKGLTMRALVKYDEAKVIAGIDPLYFVRDIFHAFRKALHVYIILEPLEQDPQTVEFLRTLDLRRLAQTMAKANGIACEFLCVRHGANVGFCKEGRKVLLAEDLVSTTYPLEM
ncbi:hypothetical protein C8Q80DRAFT_1271943 [Daedaleopsis nitida]|nr:hypothetical protein C8Q80DRAFT_1271943 [Daedaleopsis nitida]